MSRISFRLLLLLLVAPPGFALEPFVAPAVSEGQIAVALWPTDAVAPGSERLVTFGVPFPRGSITAAGLASLRVFKGDSEIPAHVDELTPWRHRSDAALDGTSVRVARVQIRYTFGGTAAEPVSVRWGGSARQLDVPGLTPVRSGWHAVTSGSFVAADGVDEPDVYALLPKSWLSLGVLKGSRSLAFDDANTEPRDDPAANAAIQHWPGYSEADRATKNNFYSAINEDDGRVTAANQCQYKTDYEPWLYDRSASMFVLYFQSGFGRALQEAVRASVFYASHLDADGFFDLREGDTKYAYAENLAYRYWLTGDDAAIAPLAAVVRAQDTFPDVWRPASNFWTERHVAFKLLAHQIAYELEGGSESARVATLLDTLVAHQNGADGQIPQPAGFVDGGLYHYGVQHDGDWPDAALGGSSWMSALAVDAIVRTYATSETASTAQLVRRLGNFLRVSTISTTEHSYDTYDGPLALPRYGVLSDGSDGQVNYEDIEHSLDVASALAWANYFAQATGSPDPRLLQTAQALYASYDEGVNYWIRPNGPASGLPAYRTAPWRKFGWEHRVASGLGWAMQAEQSPLADAIFTGGFE